MRQFPYAGPGLVVAAAAGIALLAAPLAIRRAHDADADAGILRASRILDSAPSALGIAGDDGKDAGAATAADVREVEKALPLLEQINRANRAIATLVEPSVVHVSTMMSMQRRNFTAPYASSGSGWIWDEDGHIVTNAHVVEGSDRLQVQLFDGELREAELVGLDLRSDIAVIKVASGGLHPSLRGDSSMLQQGDQVYAFGSPFDFRFSMSSGIVSGLGRTAGLTDIDYENFIQTDAAINPGNSGGPLTDIRGRVIGMNTAIATGRGNGVGQGQFAGIGLAIPMSMIESTVTQIIETGEVRKGYLGVRMIALDEVRVRGGDGILGQVAEGFKGDGVVISDVTADSPASRAGFRAGDVIIAADGQKVATNESVSAIISSRKPGSEVKFEVWRAAEDGGGGKRVDIVATLAELDASVNLAPYLPAALDRAGIAKFVTATADRARTLEVPFRRGVLLEDVREGSEIAELAPKGSTITAVFDQPVGSLDEFYTRVGRAISAMAGQRRGMIRRVEVPLSITRPDGRVVNLAIMAP
ncbi:MAG: S1C family serine protease [bacterium]